MKKKKLTKIDKKFRKFYASEEFARIAKEAADYVETNEQCQRLLQKIGYKNEKK